MKTLQQIFLQKFILLFILLFFAVGGITYYGIKSFYIQQTKISLLHNIDLLSYNLDNLKKIENISKNIKNKFNIRLTVIVNDGTVIIESHKNKKQLNNHRNREEIIKSIRNDYGFTIRYSDTLKTELLYVAKRYPYKKSFIFIRMARELDLINDEIISLAVRISLVLLLFFIILFYITYKISKTIQDEIEKISKFLLDLTKKRKNTYISSTLSKELNQITKLLSKVALVLSKKDKQKQKYTSKLKQSNSQKDDIISAISHEFKNPIAVINGYTQTLLDDKELNINIREKFLSKIYKSSTRLNNLIDTLRLSIKLDDGKYTINYTLTDMENFLKENIDIISLNYKNRDIKLDIKEGTKLKIDKTLFSIAVINLIENALKYSNDTVYITLEKNSISIKDSGIGIEKNEIDNITKKFYRVSSNHWNNSLGLGLSIVTNILNSHNFKLEIESKKNIGSTFTIKF